MTTYTSPASQDLFTAINLRLSFMKAVALYKATHHQPIEDPLREEIVLNKAKAEAIEKGLNPEQLESFFKAQIAVAKAIQYRHRADWLSLPSSSLPRDLQNDIHPTLITLGSSITEHIADYIRENRALTSSDFDAFNQTITTKHVTDRDKQLLFMALVAIKNND
ncbi:gamma subclass chorismate mutase AroQ [Photobacterium sanguinicancri]|uniref:chorismate mutase n=1 Tax=Photobacterium sanguinicancri TaxID=875932 RepID=A0AAW7Y3A3_9GAMM|nr:gamma subclass chorismate mutase AroQ [Photobacterium sanguinicancri]MDO6541428.1 gamma subclass chorismate mutase AroQ [Photobacterium sanguinicancri]OZS41710.1 chorismate mutase [Photobacterium sanguinicancri]